MKNSMCDILIAEDELIERMVLKRTLQKRFRECEIIDVENGRTAMEIFRSRQIRIAILDIEMPGMKGIEVAEHMRKENSELAIIFLTAYDKFEYARRAVSVHAMEYLLKPYSEREVVSVVEEAMRHCGGMKQGNQGGYLTDEPDEPAIPTDRCENTPEDGGSVTRLSIMVDMVEEYIRNHYMYDISMQDAARAVNYSEPYFCKIFKLQYGQSFISYLTEYRVEKAKKLLLQPNVNVREVGARVGYEDSTYFARVFRRIVGMSPSEYRNAFLKSL